MTDPSEKTFIVTGANTGVGLETARGLAAAGASVVMTARDRAKGDAALADVRASTGNGKVSLYLLDLASLDDIDRFAEEVLADIPRLDGLINNAGLGTTAKGKTKDDFELVVGTNYVGPFHLTERLLPRLLDTAERHGEARVVNVSSLAHAFARRFDPDDLFPSPRPRSRDAYAESKLANLLHARELARRYGAKGLRAHAVHPGFVASSFGRKEHFPGPWQLVFGLTKPLQIPPEKGAQPSLHAALSDEAGRLNGTYFVKSKPKQPHLPTDPDAVQTRLWNNTEGLIERSRQA
ncbi:SDR family oxidoreductase [Parvularcula dongshanensis]|uniref:NAD(P)-dependent dehydrogenase (Short-subunit alcohol dehydrogenase family) n=1 Tax=Parvularcula dongshanensis TaxID=1173995 RepID=A0A840I6S8_9PROT|nr:SDR family oxidoreductase [Parvularcula dongshanensis]MBB4660015.1 NAD(P)-dependent dehydrogenase (short-subunit alcohol dehydrogenase family) [Parvularcula dongshanensis]